MPSLAEGSCLWFQCLGTSCHTQLQHSTDGLTEPACMIALPPLRLLRCWQPAHRTLLPCMPRQTAILSQLA